jgi:hypothetical protein
MHSSLKLLSLIIATLTITACSPANGNRSKTYENASFEVPPNLPDIEEEIPLIGQPRKTLTHPAADKDFLELSNGFFLSQIKVNGTNISLSKGTGHSFNSSHNDDYLNLKIETLTDPNHKVQWAFMNLDSHEMISQSLAANKKIFGASSSKIYVAATLLDSQNGALSSSQLQLTANMLVVSSNVAWTELQKEIGNGSADLGRELNWNFTQKMGYLQTRGFQGYWGNIHGNELVPIEAVETLYDIYQNAFLGAETLWKFMHTCRTGAERGRKYIPADIYVGAKTGTYDGPTENPETGGQYNVKVRNHILVFNIDGVQYGLAIFANNGSDESVALLAGGLIREYTSIK